MLIGGTPGLDLIANPGLSLPLLPCLPLSSLRPISILENDLSDSIIIENNSRVDVFYTSFLLSLSAIAPMARLLNKIEGCPPFPEGHLFPFPDFDTFPQRFLFIMVAGLRNSLRTESTQNFF
jgi:hypothetical protein